MTPFFRLRRLWTSQGGFGRMWSIRLRGAVYAGLWISVFSVPMPPSLSALEAPHGALGLPPQGRGDAQASMQQLRDIVMTAWLNPTPENVARLPNYSQIQRLVSVQPYGPCAAAYFSAGDMVKRRMMDQVSVQMGRADACAKRAGMVFDDQSTGSVEAAPPGGRINSNGCVVRGDSMRCPPSISQMNNYAAVKLSPAAIHEKMGLSPSLTPDQLWQMGSDYYSRRMYAQAAGVFWQGANDHDPRAQAALGNMYADGVGLAEDSTLAMYWLGEAARGGNRGGEYAVAVYLEDGTQLPPNIAKAMVWYLKSANHGFPRAELRVGFGYYFGEGVVKNKALGLQWIRKASADGYGPASVYYETLTSPRSPAFRSFDEFSNYVAQLQAVQTERTLAIMRSGLQGGGNADRQGWEQKAKALEGQGNYSSAASCRAIGTYCGGL